MRLTKHWSWICIFVDKDETILDLSDHIDRIENFVVFRTNQWHHHYEFIYSNNKIFEDKFFIIRTKNIGNNKSLTGITFFLNRKSLNDYFCKRTIMPEVCELYRIFNVHKIPIVIFDIVKLISPNVIECYLKDHRPLSLYISTRFWNTEFVNELDKTGFYYLKENGKKNTLTIALKSRSELLLNKL